jgi:membrane protease YdiL (CAAX protease family)
MTAVQDPIRRFWIAVAAGWLVLGAAAIVYARMRAVPAAIAFPLALAFLVEYPFYLLPGFPCARDRLMAGGRFRASSLLAASAVTPWLIYALPTGHFNFAALVALSCMAVLMSFWYFAFPAHPAADLIYLGLFGALMLLKVFARIYPDPLPKLDVSVLGHLMLIRVMAFSMVAIRGGTLPGADYRFMPQAREWVAGLRWFAFLLPVTGAAYWALGLFALRPHPLNIVVYIVAVIGTFFGILWVTAISEEFIFRGLLQPWMEGWTGSPVAALVVTSLLFGAIHLSFRFHGGFPNWRFAIVAAILGLFCGLARRQTGGIQAGMVAHALAVAVWKIFLL